MNGSSCLVIGATGGIGTALVDRLHSEGLVVTASGRSDETLDRFRDEYGISTIRGDLRDPDFQRRLEDQVESFDIVVYNAGQSNESPLNRISVQEIESILEVNLTVPARLAARYSSARIADGLAGKIILVGSLSGLVTSPNAPVYNASKFGLRGFTLATRQYIHSSGVQCSVVEPSFVRDEGMFAASGVELPRFVRTVSTDDVAAGVVRAIRHDRTEILVAPIEQRLLAWFAVVCPRLVEMTSRVFDRTRIDHGS